LDLNRLLFVRKSESKDQLHPGDHLMIPKDAKPVTAQIHRRSFSQEISAQIVHNAANWNSMIGTDYKLGSVRHERMAIAGFMVTIAENASRMMAPSIRVRTTSLIAI
jgi:hypothetical protein